MKKFTRHARAIGPLVCILIAGAVLASGCSRKRVLTPDLGRLYDRAAQESGPDRNPVVVIPGLLGTKLVDGNGTIVWGAFGGDAIHPRKPDGKRTFALPMRPGQSLAGLQDDVVPVGVLENFRIKLLGIPLELGAYVNILSALGVGGYRDQSLGLSGAVDYGDEHFTCFQFGYDWRRDIAEAAAELETFLQERREYVREEYRERYGIEDAEVRFDLVAHSLGGLVTRYFLRYGGAPLPGDGSLPELTWAGAAMVDRAILVGPPNAGAAEALQQLVEGRKIAPLLPSYSPALLGTLPSGYQLMPRTRHRAVVDDAGRSIDLYDVETWKSNGWGLADPEQADELADLLPGVDDPAERRAIALDHLAKVLRRAEALHRALDVPARRPDTLRLHLIAGDAEETLSTIQVAADGGIRLTGRAEGDGTVLRSSALMDERIGRTWQPTLVTPIDWSSVFFIFDDHLALTRDPVFVDNVLYRLLEEPHVRIGETHRHPGRR